jgi:hypothetical protein
MMEGILLVCLVGGVVFGMLGTWIASQKNRDSGEGFALGCLFGPFGALVEALLPTMPAPGTHQSIQPPRPILSPAEEEAIRKQMEAEQVKRKADEEALAQFRRKREAEELTRKQAENGLVERERERVAREREERARLRRQKWNARRKRLEDLPEAIKIVLGTLLGIVAIAALFTIVVRLVPK